MKKLLLILALFPTIVLGQSKEDVCKKNARELDSLMQLKQFQTAIPAFDNLRKSCPDQWPKLYPYAADIFDYRISILEEDKQAPEIQNLFSFYDESIKKYPQKAKNAMMHKALAMQKYRLGTDDEVFAIYDNAFRTGRDQFDDANAIRAYFIQFIQNFRKSGKDANIDLVFQKREEIDQLITTLSANNPNSSEFQTLSNSLERLLAVELSCEKLNAYYGAEFEKRKNDTLWIEKGALRLAVAKCNKNGFAQQFLEHSYNQKPTFKVVYELGLRASQTNNIAQSERYFTEAAELASSSKERANLYYILGANVYSVNHRDKAVQYLEKAIKEDPSMGKVYLFLAQLYTKIGLDCTLEPFAKKAINWLSAETVQKAAIADPTLKEGVAVLYKRYMDAAPTPKQIKEAKMGGKKIDYACWVNKSVSVPK